MYLSRVLLENNTALMGDATLLAELAQPGKAARIECTIEKSQHRLTIFVEMGAL